MSASVGVICPSRLHRDRRAIRARVGAMPCVLERDVRDFMREEGPSLAPVEDVCIAVVAVLQALHRCVWVGLVEGVVLAYVRKFGMS